MNLSAPDNKAHVITPQTISAYHSDAPISDPTQDVFDRWPFARRIAETIAARTDDASLCIGIYGSWGEGKTTVYYNSSNDNLRHTKTFK